MEQYQYYPRKTPQVFYKIERLEGLIHECITIISEKMYTIKKTLFKWSATAPTKNKGYHKIQVEILGCETSLSFRLDLTNELSSTSLIPYIRSIEKRICNYIAQNIQTEKKPYNFLVEPLKQLQLIHAMEMYL